MATFINYNNYGDEEAIVQGAEWLQSYIQQMDGDDAAVAFVEKFKEAHGSSETAHYNVAPVFNLFVDHTAEMFTNIQEQRGEDRIRDVESFFALVFSMLMQFEDEEHLKAATTRLIDMFSNSTEHQPELRLRLLMVLYNTFNDPRFADRYRIFKNILDYASTANLFDQVLPYLEYLDVWMADWNLTVDDKRSLFLNISQYLRKLGKRAEAFIYLKKHHTLHKDESAAVLEEQRVIESTIVLVKDAIELPSVILFDDILEFDTVKALKKSKKSGDICKICELFLSGSVADLRKFHDANKKLFDEHKLSYDDAMSKMRLLALATLAHGKSELTLSEVAKALEESEDKVEPWVVRGISEGVIDGRIGQLHQKVIVKSAFQRSFQEKEWDFLDEKLNAWVDNLENVIKFIGDQKIMKEKAVTSAAAN